MRESDEWQFHEYAAARLDPLRRIGYLICGDWHLADDVVATVMVKLYVAWSRAREADNLDQYVRRMLVRAIIDERRRPWRREHPAEFPLLDHGVNGDSTEDRLVLRAALARIPPRRRAVLVLRYFEGLTIEETAQIMGCTPGTVKSQTARALATLRDLLPADYLTPDTGAREVTS
ncbi:SigE family RNA polymerase sigma factor [Dactylosporangium sp. AC04546]|uniref:SigE family RNA polymerase sigma factor n=1 Tax=Dactylosporangium sp. AC04546 TaxID=2862460 RepID=UPI001EDE5F51|nr:SigE family RNA polymerase sigma factor [Dactylosporangium sp. AC04546]WVK87018.1 SigE family RNA polymerase sigma factor [Dactylosporangium sp. AC04546]